jgi:adenine-specific DNA methylase
MGKKKEQACIYIPFGLVSSCFGSHGSSRFTIINYNYLRYFIYVLPLCFLKHIKEQLHIKKYIRSLISRKRDQGTYYGVLHVGHLYFDSSFSQILQIDMVNLLKIKPIKIYLMQICF